MPRSWKLLRVGGPGFVTALPLPASLATLIEYLPNIAFPSSTMPTDSGSSLSLIAQAEKDLKDRETFSHQTLLLTALTAINNQNHHPSFNIAEVNTERVEYMQQKAARTPVIDAATTILVTDKEILATIARGVCGMQGILTLRATQEENTEKTNLLNLKNPDLRQVDAFPQDDFAMEAVTEGEVATEGSLFVSLPNPASDLSRESSTSSGPICKPIAMDDGHWPQILESKNGFIFGSKK
jgi:hypothetical protein